MSLAGVWGRWRKAWGRCSREELDAWWPEMAGAAMGAALLEP